MTLNPRLTSEWCYVTVVVVVVVACDTTCYMVLIAQVAGGNGRLNSRLEVSN